MQFLADPYFPLNISRSAVPGDGHLPVQIRSARRTPILLMHDLVRSRHVHRSLGRAVGPRRDEDRGAAKSTVDVPVSGKDALVASHALHVLEVGPSQDLDHATSPV